MLLQPWLLLRLPLPSGACGLQQGWALLLAQALPQSVVLQAFRLVPPLPPLLFLLAQQLPVLPLAQQHPPEHQRPPGPR